MDNKEEIEFHAFHIECVLKDAREFGAQDRDIAKGLAEWMHKHLAAAREVPVRQPKEPEADCG